MSKNLVIVESPSKAKTINKYLGKNFIVEATIGHIRDLPKTKLGVDVNNNFDAQYLNIRGKGDTIKKIKSLAGKSKNIFIATDPDREGEAIAQDIADILNGNNGAVIKRVLFNEITKTGIDRAMKSPREIDSHLVFSQRARRVMDRIIGYKISPFLWKAVIELSGTGSVSAGRVQSVALKIICDREVLIQNFIPTEYWSIWALFKTERGESFKAKLFSVEKKEIKVPPKPKMSEYEWETFFQEYFAIRDQKEAQSIYDRINKLKQFVISNISKRKIKRNAPAPFITSTIQSEASRRLGMRPRQTMMIAQKLYEGIELGAEGIVGLITYMRTDSTRISEEAIRDAREFISEKFGNNYISDKPNLTTAKGKNNVQDAHEAIRPTSLKYSPEFVKPFLDNKSFKLYELVWKRFIASQMASAVMETTVVEISSDEFVFRALGTAVLFNGFQQMYEEVNEPKENAEEKEEYRNEKIPVGLEENQSLILSELKETQHFTKPPARFTESSLIKELESKGIGRPSTYAQTVSTIQDRKYVILNEKKLSPTKLGIEVNKILVKNFPNIINEDFTSKMENELDEIAQGENNYVKVLNDFYIPFNKTLQNVESNIEKIICDLCGHEMEIKIGRFGKYLACSNYPNCKNIKSFRDIASQNAEPEYTGEKCEKCGHRTVIRNGKFGRFIGCERYPECDFIKNIDTGVVCPKCKVGMVVERQSKRKKIFYSCSTYPKCDFVSWNKPVNVPCPNSDSDYMEKKYSVKKGNFLKCPVCGEEKIIETVEETENES